MHVGFSLLTLFPGRMGGSETYAAGLLKALARGPYAAGAGSSEPDREPGGEPGGQPDRLTVLANRHVMGAYGGMEGVGLHHVRSYRCGDRDLTRLLGGLTGLALPRLAARDVPAGLDVIHHPLTVPIPQTGAPTVLTLFDLQHLELPGRFSRAERIWRHWTYDGAARRADIVVTLSEHARAVAIERLALSAERVRAIPAGVDHDRFVSAPAQSDASAAALDLPERFVLYPANAWPHKNHERLLRAFAAARAEDPQLNLVLTGQRHRRRLEGPGVRHLGHVTDDALPELYRRALALVFPSLSEGFGLPVLEAMACGCPVACSDHPSLREVVDEAGLLFDATDEQAITDAIGRVASDQERRAQLRAAGLARAAQYSWQVAAEAHVEAYTAAYAAASSRPSR